MELFLHIGTNKTASSYLQTLQTQNKIYLEKEGIYIPSSQWDKDMKAGIITPGNGHKLAKILCLPKKLDEKLENYLRQLKKEGESKNCGKVCLSNEVLIRLFSNKDILDALSNTAKKVGFIKVNMLCYLRNPYEHALSLYKHRMKSGKVISYEQWLQSGYKTLDLFQPFLKHYDDFDNIHWTFRVYRKDSEYLSQVYFNDFLGVKSQKFELIEKKKVNPSMSLRGIKIMNIMEDIVSGAGRAFYTYCMKRGEKVKESSDLEAVFFGAYHQYIQEYNVSLISQMVRLLPEKGKAEYRRIPKKEWEQTEISPLSVSKKELRVICLSLLSFMTSKRKGKQVLKKIINMFNPGFLRKKNNFDKKRYGGALRP